MFVSSVGCVPAHPSGPLGEAAARAGFATPGEDLGTADLVLVTDPSHDLLTELDAMTPERAIFALVDTEAVTELADASGRPELVVGLFARGERLLEVVEGEETSDATAHAAANFARSLKRQAVRCLERPGLIVEAIGAAEDPLAEACRIVEEGCAGVRDVDVAMAVGAGMRPGPFAAADAAGLDTIDDPPTLVRRLVAQGRLGAAAGQGFYPYPPDGDGPVLADVRGDVTVLWLANPPANSLSPDVLAALRSAWDAVGTRAVVLASANPALFCAGADIKAFGAMDPAEARALADAAHDLLADFERSPIATVAAVNGLAFGGGCEIAMGCDVRLAADAAIFGQPEIDLGIIPGFGGTQRLPRLAGEAKALEMNLTGVAVSAADAFAHGLVNDVVADHELFDAALNWAGKLAGQAPAAIGLIKRASGQGVDAEKDAFAEAFATEDAREGIDAFLGKRAPKWQGR